ncbi:DUF1573 domain-containing protein [Lewinella cohaerens]|uniref:DUF1573 domain-containing protein n=1 Tax=Lewinella cohaerens TaxID=70995 RepID=UPI0003676E39|nr:DUF1573 domain-containing protein [Lewinella cohaerens]
MRHLLLTLSFLVLLLPLGAQDTPQPSDSNTAKGVMTFAETTFDFGTITEGKSVVHDFTFTNTGNAHIRINAAQSSCGCAVPQWPREPIAPGETGTITITFYSMNKPGYQEHRLHLLTEYTWPAEHFLYLVGNVEPRGGYPEVAPIPPPQPASPAGPITEMTFGEMTFDFGTITEGEVVAHTYTFTNTGDEPLVLSNAKGSCGCTIPAWPQEPIAPGETASMTVEFNSKGKTGQRNQKVTITANTNPVQTFIYLTGRIMPRDASLEMPTLLEADETPAAPTVTKPDPNCVTLYPNPTTDQLQLKMGDQAGQPATFALYNYSGQLMARRELEAVEAVVSFDVRHYPAGNYVIQLQVGKRPPETQCFVVKK